MKAVILTIGDEVLEGDVINSDAAYVSNRLIGLGYSILYHKTIGDHEDAVQEAFNEAYALADLIVTTGGLGPTKDDMSKKAIADALGLEMVKNTEIENWLRERYRGRQLTQNNLVQCYFPAGAIPLTNNNGTAPGVFLASGEKTIIMLPGPPRELNPMFDEFAIPLLNKPVKTFAEKYYMTAGIGEAPIEEKVRNSLDESPDYMVNTYLTSSGVMFKATGYGKDENEAQEAIGAKEPQLLSAIAPYLYATEKTELWRIVVRCLIENSLTISAAESFTGGLFSEYLSRVDGISSIFKGSVVPYSLDAKEGILGVDRDIINEFGTIAPQTAEAMAVAAGKLFGTDIAVSFTGIAGRQPVEGKDPGTAYIGLFFKGETISAANQYKADRAAVKERAVTAAFWQLYLLLTKNGYLGQPKS